MPQELYNNSIEYAKFLKNYRKKNGEKLLPSSIERYVEIINPYMPDLIKLRKDIDGMIEYMNAEVKKRRSIILSSSFRNYIFFIGYDAEKDEDIFKKLKTPPINATSLTSKRVIQTKIISRQELKMLYDSGRNDYEKLIYSILYDTACRRDELLKIRHKDILFMNSEKNSEDIKNGIHAHILLHGKGGKTRTVYLSKITCNLYKKLFDSPNEDDKVFIMRKQNGEKLKNQTQGLYDFIKSRGKDILNRHIHPHCFRHTKLTHLADDGAEILGIKAYAGHEDVATSQIYVDISSFVGKRVFSNYSKPIVE